MGKDWGNVEKKPGGEGGHRKEEEFGGKSTRMYLEGALELRGGGRRLEVARAPRAIQMLILTPSDLGCFP